MFRVGDRVRALRSAEGQYTRGNIYVVSRINEFGITTELDDAGSTSNGWGNEYFELVEPRVPQIEVTTYLIYYRSYANSPVSVIACSLENDIEAYKRHITRIGPQYSIIGVKKIKVRFPGVPAE